MEKRLMLPPATWSMLLLKLAMNLSWEGDAVSASMRVKISLIESVIETWRANSSLDIDGTLERSPFTLRLDKPNHPPHLEQ